MKPALKLYQTSIVWRGRKPDNSTRSEDNFCGDITEKLSSPLKASAAYSPRMHSLQETPTEQSASKSQSNSFTLLQ